MYSKLFKEIIKRSFRIPISATPTDSSDYTTVRQLDSALMSIGFKLSKRTIEYLNRLSHKSILTYSADVLAAVRELVGDHVEHNAYKGMQNMNMIEENRMSTALLVKSIVERKYLCIKYLIDILAYKAESFSWYNEKEQETRDNTTFIGVDVPKGLPKNTSVYTVNNIQDLLPI